MRILWHVRIGWLCLLLIAAFSPPVTAQDELRGAGLADDPAVQTALDELKRIYSTEIILGQPMRVEDRQIVPLAIAGFGFGSPGTPETDLPSSGGVGVGGVMIPVGVLIIPDDGEVQLLQLSKGFFEQLISGIAPLMVRMMTQPQAQEPTAEMPAGQAAGPQLGKIRDALASMRVVIVALFLLGWLAMIVVIALFLPRQVISLADTLHQRFWPALLTGLLGAIVAVLLVAVLTISLIGIPLTFVVLVLTCAFMVFGSGGLALLIGQRLGTALKQTNIPDLLFVLIGGVIVGILGVLPIPLFGLIVWTIVSMLSLGAVLLRQWEVVRNNTV